ncbi:MAG: SDR family oxidoreductase [Nocardioides sp.]|nr:SDR family oxidoreductase [Nocardioides sp.]
MADDLLRDRVVLVSGGTRGLGAAVADAALRNGANVVVTGRGAEAGAAYVARARDAGGEAHYVPCDVGDVDQVRAAVDRTVELYGRVDALASCAGLTSRGTLLDTTPELLDQHVAVNTKGPFFLMQAAVRDMLRRGEGGSIVNLITMSALGGQPYLAPYVASKSALIGLTKNVAHAHRHDRIRVNGLNIGWTYTEGEDEVQRRYHGAEDGWQERAGATLPMGRLARPDEIADLVVFLLSDRSGVVTGSVIDWDQTVPGAYDQ